MSDASWSEIEQVLARAHALAGAAEAHGTLAGSLCAAPGYRFEDWLHEILPDLSAEVAVDPALRELYGATTEALVARDMAFQPLLPDDEAALDSRASALGQWCQGFLYGLGSSAIQDPAALPGDVGEIVRDLGEITHVGVDAQQSLESNESAYAELVEFVRVGVQLVFDELEPLRASTPPAPQEGALH